MEKAIRILEIVTAMNVDNGVSSFVMNYLRRLDHSVFTVDFAVCIDYESPFYKEIESYGGRVYVLPQMMSVVKHLKECNRILKNNRYDIVHDNALTQSFLLMREARKHNIPVRILHSHNAQMGETILKSIRNKMILHLLKKSTTHYAACSNKAGECYFADGNFTIIPNIVDEVSVEYNSEDREIILKNRNLKDKIVVGTVGRLAIQKNPKFALRVFKELRKQNHNVIYWWIGSGPLHDEIKEYIRELEIQDSVFLMGRRTDMHDLYHAIDVFFLPSLFEGLPVTGVEAQAMGIPCVVSDTVTKEMVYTDLVDFIPLDAHIETWVKAIEKQMKRIPERRSYREELKESIFSADSAGERLEAYYKGLLYDTGERR